MVEVDVPSHKNGVDVEVQKIVTGAEDRRRGEGKSGGDDEEEAEEERGGEGAEGGGKARAREGREGRGSGGRDEEEFRNTFVCTISTTSFSDANRDASMYMHPSCLHLTLKCFLKE